MPPPDAVGAVTCSTCAIEHPAGKKFCDNCGTSLDPVTARVAAYLQSSVKPQVEAVLAAKFGQQAVVETEIAERVANKLIGWGKILGYVLSAELALLLVLLGWYGYGSISDIKRTAAEEQQSAKKTIDSQISIAVNDSQKNLDAARQAEQHLSEELNQDSSLAKANHEKATSEASQLKADDVNLKKEVSGFVADVNDLTQKIHGLAENQAKQGGGDTIANQLNAEKKTLGTSVSHFQGSIDWNKVKSAGVAFAFIKASEGAKVDQAFVQNWQEAKAAGLVRGAYLYFHPGESTEQQAALFLDTLRQTSGDLPPVVDFETSGGADKDVVLSEVERLLQTIRDKTGCTPVLYTPYSFWKAIVASSTEKARFAAYPLFVADYTPSSAPRQLSPWTDWTFWDSSSTGTVALPAYEIVAFNGTRQNLIDFAQKSCSVTRRQ